MSMHVQKLAMIGALALAAPLAMAGPQAGDRSVTLTGSGTSDDSFDQTNYGVTGSIGWFTSDMLEVGIRQSANGVVVDDGDSRWAGSTRGYVDWHFGNEGTIPFIGANLGGVYGEDVNDTGSAGLEAGLKFYVKDKTFILAMAEWQFLFDEADEIDDQFDDGAWFYTLGVGFNF